ncbi:MAG: hypothetical protein DU429_06460 [Candidatus Tokpelaia sp.]|nr:MAG: hypothetical protein DU430_02000 [Candidatus Tokpelaia sp.]KAA6206206.1 MAG: hypothetical protein DU429_06460 [Candidatus Tokpelaia sp.]
MTQPTEGDKGGSEFTKKAAAGKHSNYPDVEELKKAEENLDGQIKALEKVCRCDCYVFVFLSPLLLDLVLFTILEK